MLSPISIGDCSPWPSTFTTDSGVFPLTGILSTDITMHFSNKASPQVIRIGLGAFQVTNAASGEANFTPDPTDVANPGIYMAYPVIYMRNATPPYNKAFDPQILEIRNLT